MTPTTQTKCPPEEVEGIGGRKQARLVRAGLALPRGTPKAC